MIIESFLWNNNVWSHEVYFEVKNFLGFNNVQQTWKNSTIIKYKQTKVIHTESTGLKESGKKKIKSNFK